MPPKKDSSIKVLISGNRRVRLTPLPIGVLLAAIIAASFGIGVGLFWASKTFESTPSPANADQATEALRTSVEGHAYLSNERSEGSNILRGMSVYLCTSNLIQGFQDIRKTYRLDEYDAGYEIRQVSSVGKMEEFAQSNCGSPVQTDVNGFYSFSEVASGSYLIFAPLYGARRSNTPYWLIPVTVGRESVKQDMNGSNWGFEGIL